MFIFEFWVDRPGTGNECTANRYFSFSFVFPGNQLVLPAKFSTPRPFNFLPNFQPFDFQILQFWSGAGPKTIGNHLNSIFGMPPPCHTEDRTTECRVNRPFVRLFVCLYFFLSLFVCLFVWLFVCVFVCLFVYLFVRSFVCLFDSLTVCLFVCFLFVCLCFVYSLVSLFLCLLCLFVFICLFVC